MVPSLCRAPYTATSEPLLFASSLFAPFADTLLPSAVIAVREDRVTVWPKTSSCLPESLIASTGPNAMMSEPSTPYALAAKELPPIPAVAEPALKIRDTASNAGPTTLPRFVFIFYSPSSISSRFSISLFQEAQSVYDTRLRGRFFARPFGTIADIRFDEMKDLYTNTATVLRGSTPRSQPRIEIFQN